MKRFLLFAALFLAILLYMGCSEDTDTTKGTALQEVSDSDDSFSPADSLITGESSEKDTNSKVCEPVAPVSWPEPDLTSGPSVVSFDSDLFFTVNGTRFFPMGFYSVPTDTSGLATFKSEGFNIALTGPGCCGGTSLQDQIALLERADDEGVMIILHPWTPTSQVLTRTDQELADELDARNDIGSLFGWYTFDEPGLHVPDKVLTGRMHNVLATYDPNHLDSLVDAPLNDYSMYVDDCAFFMVDPYPSQWVPLIYIKATMEEAKEATQELKPVVGVMQAFSWDRYEGVEDTPYHPDGRDMRNMTWQFIVNGATGLIPWNYGGSYTIHYQPEIWDAYLAVVEEINELMRIVLTSNEDIDLNAETDFPTLFDYQVKIGDNATWVFSVSANDRKMRVTLDLSPLGDTGCIVDYTTGDVFTPDDEGKIVAAYDPLQVRIFQIIP